MSAGDKFTKDTTAQEVAETFGDRIKGKYGASCPTCAPLV